MWNNRDYFAFPPKLSVFYKNTVSLTFSSIRLEDSRCTVIHPSHKMYEFLITIRHLFLFFWIFLFFIDYSIILFLFQDNNEEYAVWQCSHPWVDFAAYLFIAFCFFGLFASVFRSLPSFILIYDSRMPLLKRRRPKMYWFPSLMLEFSWCSYL